MVAVEAIAYHGWGFDSSCWQAWQELLTQKGWTFKAFDRGYFQPAHSPKFTNQTAIHVLLIHSYGLHLCPIEQFEQADLLLSFNSFLTFHSADELIAKRSRRVVNQMIQSFQTNPNLVLETFYQNCNYPRSIQVTQPDQRELLLSDLANLNVASFDPSSLLGIPKILIFQGAQDQILAPAIGQACFDRVREDSQYCEYFEFEDAGHALPFTEVAACWDIVQQALIQDESPDFMAGFSNSAIATPEPDQSPSDPQQKVADRFGQSSQNYNAQALLQKDCAVTLLTLLEPWWQKLPAGNVLEIGCGTGFITQGLVQQLQARSNLTLGTQASAIEHASSFPGSSARSLEVTDLSVAMLNFCQQQLETFCRQQLETNQTDLAIAFRQLDGADISALTTTYALIVSGFVIQWFRDPVRSIQMILEKLQPGGLLCLSFPSCHSFPEWRQMCQELDLPMTANPLPDSQKLIHATFSNSSLVCLKEMMLETTHPSALEFFKQLKLIGAGLSLNGDRLSPQQMKQLIRYWDQKHPQVVHVQHHIVYLLIQRNA